jgi:hypothetical protein
MKDPLSPLPDPVVHFDLQLFDTARRRAERLREQAIDDALHGAARAPGALLRLLGAWLQRAPAQAAGPAGKAPAA